MKKVYYYCVFGCFTMFLSVSCSFEQGVDAALSPNRCKKCVVISKGEEVWSDEGCGGGRTYVERKAQIAAYDYGCDSEVSCSTWKEEKDEDEDDY